MQRLEAAEQQLAAGAANANLLTNQLQKSQSKLDALTDQHATAQVELCEAKAQVAERATQVAALLAEKASLVEAQAAADVLDAAATSGDRREFSATQAVRAELQVRQPCLYIYPRCT